MSFVSNFKENPNIPENKCRENLSSVNQAGNSSLEISKRDVYPQFSEPDEYNSMAANRSVMFKSFSSQQSKKKTINERNLIYSRPMGKNSSMHQSTSNKQLPTFRQYIADKTDEDMEQCYDDNDKIDNRHAHSSKDNKRDNFNYRKGTSICNENFGYKNDKNEDCKGNKQISQNVSEKAHKQEFIGTRTRYVIGTIDQVIRWYKAFKDAEYELIFEVAGVLESKIKKDNKHLMFIRSNSGHTLQGVFYTIDRELPDFQLGSTITATGNMIGSNKLQIFDAAEMNRDDFTSIQRLAFLSQRSLQEPIYNRY